MQLCCTWIPTPLGTMVTCILQETQHRMDKCGRSIAEKHTEGKCGSNRSALWPFCPIFIFSTTLTYLSCCPLGDAGSSSALDPPSVPVVGENRSGLKHFWLFLSAPKHLAWVYNRDAMLVCFVARRTSASGLSISWCSLQS